MKDPDGTMRAEVPAGNRRVDAMASGCVAKGSGSLKSRKHRIRGISSHVNHSAKSLSNTLDKARPFARSLDHLHSPLYPPAYSVPFINLRPVLNHRTAPEQRHRPLRLGSISAQLGEPQTA